MNDYEKVIAIVGITEALKQYGIPSVFCASVAILLGGFFNYLENPHPYSILMGMALGAVVTGFYTLIKRIGKFVFGSIKKQRLSQLEHDLDRTKE
jgi:hypothetical protein